MTLKEQIIDQVLEMPLESSPTQKDIDNYNLSINHLEKIAEDFAIGFAEWVKHQPKYKKVKKSGLDNCYIEMSSKELLEIYKKEKGL